MADPVLYQWLVWSHIVSIFGFLIAHGGSSLVIFSIKGEREPQRLRALLDFSRKSVQVSYAFVVLVLITGSSLAFLGGWWGQLWIWTAIGVAFVMMGLMYQLGTAYMNGLRKAAGLPFFEKRKKQEPLPPATAEELGRLVGSSRPIELSAIGIVGLLAIAYLMLFKPF